MTDNLNTPMLRKLRNCIFMVREMHRLMGYDKAYIVFKKERDGTYTVEEMATALIDRKMK